MAKTNDKKNTTAIELPAETVKKTDASADISAPNTKCTRRHGIYRILPPLIALIALILSLNASVQIWQANQSRQNQKNEFNHEIAELKQQQNDTAKQLAAATKNIADITLESQNKITALNKRLQSTFAERAFQKQDWLLLKTRHYLELAQINAHWNDDPQTAIALLQQADSTLQDVTIQPIFPIRQTIAKEIALLQALPLVDIPGILSQLDAAQTIVSKLPLTADPVKTDTGSSQDTNNPSQSAWQNHLQKNMRFLEKLIVIKHYDDNVQPALSPIQQALLRESIRISLQEAQWAVLQNNTQLYQQSLEQALQNIKRTFKNNPQATEALIKQLQTLQQKKLRAEKPTIDQSLQHLNQLINSPGNLPAQPLPATSAGEKT